ncbi:MAG TPA: type II secretory protein PulD [Acidobacteriaceae bacterium]|jgi:Flp pilus assembly secretin CpaC|nr:type II secretory protein PulD [Acidobacteriaceae bacterium]
MPTKPSRRSPHRGLCSGPRWLRRGLALGLALLTTTALSQTPASSPASTPAGADAPATPTRSAAITSHPPSSKQVREAEDAYLEGAKEIEHKDLAAAQKSFARAVQLNPNSRDYALALAVTREHRLTELVQSAAKARLLGNTARADALLEQARAIDPDNAIVAQHFNRIVHTHPEPVLPLSNPVVASLGGPIDLAPTKGTRDIHLKLYSKDLIRSVYADFGIKVAFDPSVTDRGPLRVDVDQVTFAGAERILHDLTHTIAVPVQPTSALIAADTEENRSRLLPQYEETVYMPGLTQEQMTEMANLARNIFDLKSITASSSTDTIVLRGDRENLKVLNATYDNMLGGGSDVLLDVNLYEIDRTNTRNIGFQLPSSAGIFSVAAEAAQLVSANQSLIDQAIASGLIKLTGNSFTDLITEVGFLIASGTVSVTQYTNLLGIFGNGLSLAGLYVGSGASFNLLLNSGDTRILDAVQLRSGDKQLATFRAGSRYPIITSTYTSGISSSLASSVSGLNIGGTSVSSLLSQYLGTSSVTIPQVQFEDLGLTLAATPQVLHDHSVLLKLDLKIESLGGTALNGIPILNNRELTSTVTIPAGQSALLASEVSSSETRDVQGIPGLSELPGFTGTTNSNVEKDTGELLITITPHIVRENTLRIAARPLLVPHSKSTNGAQFELPLPAAPETSPVPAPRAPPQPPARTLQPPSTLPETAPAETSPTPAPTEPPESPQTP